MRLLLLGPQSWHCRSLDAHLGPEGSNLRRVEHPKCISEGPRGFPKILFLGKALPFPMVLSLQSLPHSGSGAMSFELPGPDPASSGEWGPWEEQGGKPLPFTPKLLA